MFPLIVFTQSTFIAVLFSSVTPSLFFSQFYCLYISYRRLLSIFLLSIFSVLDIFLSKTTSICLPLRMTLTDVEIFLKINSIYLKNMLHVSTITFYRNLYINIIWRFSSFWLFLLTFYVFFFLFFFFVTISLVVNASLHKSQFETILCDGFYMSLLVLKNSNSKFWDLYCPNKTLLVIT